MDLDDLMLAAGKAHPGYSTDAASSSMPFGPTSTPWATRSILQHHQQSRALGDLSDPWLQTTNRIVAGVGIGISTSLLIMRIYTKTRIMSKFWWDDSMFIASSLFLLYQGIEGTNIFDNLAFVILAWVCEQVAALVKHIE